VEPGEVIALSENARDVPDVRDLIEEAPLIPSWLKRQDGGGRVLREPDSDEIDRDIQEQLIVEFYSR
jgi:ribosomal protein S4